MRHITLMVLLLFQLAVEAQPLQLRADKTKSYIKYYMKHAVHAWTGMSKEVSCVMQVNAKGEVEKVAATSKLKSFDSENSNRDSHMLEVTDALTHPSINFYSTSVTKKEGEYVVRGVLAFHGVEKNIEFKLKEDVNGKDRIFTGNFIFLLEDYAIERPTLFLVKTNNEVKVELFIVF
jgi:polyisoprenoid-binding protein YceI